MRMYRATIVAFAVGLAVAPPVSASPEDPACPGVRPGAAMLRVGGGIVTSWNFILSGSDGGTYTFVDGEVLTRNGGASVEASPLVSTSEERTWARGKGPAFSDGAGRPAAHAVWYARFEGDKWALLRLDRGVRWQSAVCGFARPRALDTTIDNGSVVVSIYGQQTDRPFKAHQDVLPWGRYATDETVKSLPTSSGNWSAPVLSGEENDLALGMLANSCCTGGFRDLRPGSGGKVYRLPPLMDRAGEALGIGLLLAKPEAGVAR